MNLAYCDMIANIVNKKVDGGFFKSLGISLDLHPEFGYFMSTKKTIRVVDQNGRKYKITVEEDNE